MSDSTPGDGRRPARVTARDMAIVEWIGRHGVVTADQVAARYFRGRRAAYRRLDALRALGLVRRDHTFWREPAALRVTPAGARLVDLSVAPAELVLPEVRHGLALVTLSERLLRHYSGATYVTERELRAAELRARRQLPDHSGYQRIPDGLLLLPDGHRVAIELDLTNKRTVEIERIVTCYQNMHLVGGDQRISSVIWYARPPEAARIRACVERKDCGDLIAVEEWRP